MSENESVNVNETAESSAPEEGAETAAPAGEAAAPNFAAAVAALEGKPAPEEDSAEATEGEESTEDDLASDDTPAPPPEDKKEETPKESALFEKKFAELQREWQRLDKERQGLKQTQKEFQELKQNLELAKKFPAKAFELLGVDAEKFTEEYVAKGGKLTEAEKIALEAKAEVVRLQEMINEQKQHQEASQQQALVGQYRNEALNFLKAAPDDYELVLADPAGVDRVMEVINAHYQRTFDASTGQGEILTYEKAAKAVEGAYEQELNSILKLRKVAKKVKPVENESAAPRASKSAKTLTGNMTPSTRAERPLTADERFKTALKMLSK